MDVCMKALSSLQPLPFPGSGSVHWAPILDLTEMPPAQTHTVPPGFVAHCPHRPAVLDSIAWDRALGLRPMRTQLYLYH